MSYEITFNLLGKENITILLEPSTKLMEVIAFLSESFPDLLGNDPKRVIITSKILNVALDLYQTMFQILGNKKFDTFNVEISKQSTVFSQQPLFSSAYPQNFVKNPNQSQYENQVKQSGFGFQAQWSNQQPQFGNQSQNVPQDCQFCQSNKQQQALNIQQQNNQQQNQQQSVNQSSQGNVNISFEYNGQVVNCALDLTTTLQDVYSYMSDLFQFSEELSMVCENQNLSNMQRTLELKDLQIKDGSEISFVKSEISKQLQQQTQFQQSQQQKPLPFCQQHGQEIYALCFNSACNQSKLVCFDCITDKIHFGHPDSLKKYSDLEGILNQKRQECNNILSKLDDMLNEILFEYSKLKLGIENKFNIPKEKINQMSNDNFSQYLLNIIQFEQQAANIIKLMKEYCKDFTNKLKNQVIELELDQLNYLEVSKKKSRKAEKLYHQGDSNILLQGYTMYYDKKNFEEAITLFNQALIYNPKHILSLWCKGASLSKLSFYQESVESYDQALAIDPFHISTLRDKCESLRKMNFFQFSISCFDSEIETQPIGQDYQDFSAKFNILNKEKIKVGLDRSTSIKEIQSFLVASFPEQFRFQYKDYWEVIDQKLQQDKKKIIEVLGNQHFGEFDVFLEGEVFDIKIEVEVLNREHILNFNPNQQLQELKEPILSKLKASFEQADVEFFIDQQPMIGKLTKTLNQLGLNENNFTITAKVRKLFQ